MLLENYILNDLERESEKVTTLNKGKVILGVFVKNCCVQETRNYVRKYKYIMWYNKKTFAWLWLKKIEAQ